MELWDLGVLGLAAFLTSALTAVAGLGGGVVLLAVLLLYLPPLEAIPVHGAIQLASNASRVWIQRRWVAWPAVGRFAWLLAPGAGAGLFVLQQLPAAAMRAAIGVFALLATWLPRVLLLGVRPDRLDPVRRFVGLGAVIGFATTTFGGSGPLLAPFLRDLGWERRRVVGTFAACQSLGHAVKIALFLLTGFAFAPYGPLLLMMIVLVVAGTAAGSRLLDLLSERAFARLYQIVITLIALRLIADALPPLY